MNTPDAQDGELLYEAVSNLVRAYQFRDRERICCHDISLNQWSALGHIIENGPIGLGAMADHLVLDKSTASRVVDSLVRRGFVKRVESAGDRRAICLDASAEGLAIYKGIRTGLVFEEERLMSDLTPEMRRAAIALITRLTEAARTSEPMNKTACATPACVTPAPRRPVRTKELNPSAWPLAAGGAAAR